MNKLYELSSYDIYTKGYLKGYVNGFIYVNNVDYEFLYRYDDIENGKNYSLVSIDYGYKLSNIQQIFTELEKELKNIVEQFLLR